jgi:hypothetical protein
LALGSRLAVIVGSWLAACSSWLVALARSWLLALDFRFAALGRFAFGFLLYSGQMSTPIPIVGLGVP